MLTGWWFYEGLSGFEAMGTSDLLEFYDYNHTAHPIAICKRLSDGISVDVWNGSTYSWHMFSDEFSALAFMDNWGYCWKEAHREKAQQ